MSWNMEVLYKSGPPSSHSSGPCLYSSTCEFSAFGGVFRGGPQQGQVSQQLADVCPPHHTVDGGFETLLSSSHSW